MITSKQIDTNDIGTPENPYWRITSDSASKGKQKQEIREWCEVNGVTIYGWKRTDDNTPYVEVQRS